MDYSDMLKRGLARIPPKKQGGERFEMPEAAVQQQGSRTVIKNFSEIAAKLRREPTHVLRFLLKELATSGGVEPDGAVFQGGFSGSTVNKKLGEYAREFVFCNECKKPDTGIVKEGGVTVLQCEACGARRTVRQL